MIQSKLVDEISLSFPGLFIIGKYMEIRFKNSGYHAISSVLKVKISNILPELNKIVFVYILGFIFSGVCPAKTDLQTIY